MTEHGCSIANRPPDAALSPVDVAFAGIEDRAREVCADNERLRAQVAALESSFLRVGENAQYWCDKWLASQHTVKRLIWLCCIVIPALVAAALWGRL